MRILRVIHSMDPKKGGLVTWITSSNLRLMALGYTVHVVCLDEPSALFLQNLPFTVTALGPGVGTYGYTKMLKKWLLENRYFDIIVVEGLWQYTGSAVYRACKKTLIPYIVFPHGMLDPWFNKTYWFKFLKKYVYWLFREYFILKAAKKVIFTSDEEYQSAQKSFKPYNVKAAVMPLGIETPIELNQKELTCFLEKYPVLKGKRILLFLSRIHPKKGLELLLQGWKNLNLQDPSLRMHLVIAGPCEDKLYKKQLMEKAKQLGIDTALLWIDMVEKEEKWALYTLAEVLILPSHQENFGMVVAESLAAGTPVFTTYKVNTWSYIIKEHSGYIERDTMSGVSNLLKKWKLLPIDQLALLKKNSKICFSKYFNIEMSVKNFLEIIHRII